jgi:redox-sensitive bicupin YhaK (pirin superfamily)
LCQEEAPDGDQPVVQYDPFVMNTRSEIREAISDFNRGKFGCLED